MTLSTQDENFQRLLKRYSCLEEHDFITWIEDLCFFIHTHRNDNTLNVWHELHHLIFEKNQGVATRLKHFRHHRHELQIHYYRPHSAWRDDVLSWFKSVHRIYPSAVGS